MADILAKATDANHPDPEVDRAGCYKKGDVVEVRESGAPRGALEGLPTFVIVECPEVTKAQVLDRMESWRTVLDWGVVARDLALDGWRLRLFVTNPGTLNRAPVTLAQVQGWLEGWNGAIVSAATNEVRFDVSVYGAATSDAFWGASGVAGLGFAEMSYDQGTGVHRLRVDYSVMIGEGSHRSVLSLVQSRNATNIIQDESLSLIEFDILRTLVTGSFKAELKAALERVHKRRRWYFTAAQVDVAIAAGGVIQVTAAQLAAAAKDAMED